MTALSIDRFQQVGRRKTGAIWVLTVALSLTPSASCHHPSEEGQQKQTLVKGASVQPEDRSARLDGLIRQLTNTSPGFRSHAARMIGSDPDFRANPRAVQPLIAALTDTDTDVRESAASALFDMIEFGEVKAPGAVDPLIDLLRDPNPRVSSIAAKTLGAIKDPRAAKPLADALMDKKFPYPMAAVTALREIGAPVAGPLIAALKSRDDRDRNVIVYALNQLPNADMELIAALKDPDPKIRNSAAGRLSVGTVMWEPTRPWL